METLIQKPGLLRSLKNLQVWGSKISKLYLSDTIMVRTELNYRPVDSIDITQKHWFLDDTSIA